MLCQLRGRPSLFRGAGWDSCQAQPFPPALRAVSAVPEGPGMQKLPGPTPLASACCVGPDTRLAFADSHVFATRQFLESRLCPCAHLICSPGALLGRDVPCPCWEPHLCGYQCWGLNGGNVAGQGFTLCVSVSVSSLLFPLPSPFSLTSEVHGDHERLVWTSSSL